MTHSDDHDHGLAHDLRVLARAVDRRRALAWLAGAGTLGALGFVGCGGSGDGSSAASTSSGGATAAASSSGTVSSCAVTSEETAGPYPADGSNASAGGTSDVLTLNGIVRSDIRSSIAGATGAADGVALTVELQLVDTNSACADLSGYAFYIWHCDRDGRYSLYSAGVTNQNYLRGVQETDSAGKASFTTIFPACYPGRMPHIHVEVYRTTTTATSWANKLKTTQIALPVDVCQTVYASASGYSASIANLAAISFATDNVFSDGVTTELATVAGSVAAGYTASLVVGIAV